VVFEFTASRSNENAESGESADRDIGERERSCVKVGDIIEALSSINSYFMIFRGEGGMSCLLVT
jgi:hypothetical protein